MSRLSSKRPSAGVMIGLLALVMAIGGVAVAAPVYHSKITKAMVRSIADQEIASLAHGLSVKSASTANAAKLATNVYSANVRADGTMLGSIPSGATSSRIGAGGPGSYIVSFGRNITGCVISGSAAGVAPPTATETPIVGVGVENATTLLVDINDPGGRPLDAPFEAQMICPPS